MAILPTQWWPFREECVGGGGCSLADSVPCDIRKDLFALNTVLVIVCFSGIVTSLLQSNG